MINIKSIILNMQLFSCNFKLIEVISSKNLKIHSFFSNTFCTTFVSIIFSERQLVDIMFSVFFYLFLFIMFSVDRENQRNF